MPPSRRQLEKQPDPHGCPEEHLKRLPGTAPTASSQASDFKDDEQRAVLVDTGFLRPVMKGWYICSSPSDGAGDFHRLVRLLLGLRLGLPGQSALASGICRESPRHRGCCAPGNTTVPRQVTCVDRQRHIEGGPALRQLTARLSRQEPGSPGTRGGARCRRSWPVAEALCLAGPSFFINHPREAEIALATIRSASELLPTLLAGDKMVTARRAVGGRIRVRQAPRRG
jgi:hypothetical protein